MLSSQRLWPKSWSCRVAFMLSPQFICEALNSQAARLEALVRSRNDSKADADNIASVERHRQFPSVRPGTFMRASAPRFSKSCKGVIARAAGEDHASRIIAGAASLLSP